jgi:hypothetical protein
MEQSDIKKLMEDKPPVPPAKVKAKPGKWPILSKFLKDVGHFVFDEKSASDELKKDLTVLESVRAEERVREKADREAAELKQKEERAKAKALKEKEEADSRKKAEEIKQAKLAEAKAKKMSFKTRLANRFKKERTGFDERQLAIARHLLQTKSRQSMPVPPRLQPAPQAPKAGGFGWFKPRPRPDRAKLPASLSARPAVSLGLPPMPPVSGAIPAPAGKQQAAVKFKEERLQQQGVSQKEQIENRSWQSFGVVHTNLIREQRGMFLNWQSKILWLLLFVALAGLISVAAYGFLLILEKDKISSSQGTFTNLTSIVAQIQSEEVYAEEILNFNNKLLAVSYLLNNHIYWSNFFKFLEDYTIKDAYYEKFTGDLSGKYILPAVAKDYRSISNQLRVLQSAGSKVMSVDTGGAASTNPAAAPVTPGAATSTPNVRFDLNLNLDRSIFIKEPQYAE